jgi:hypothetical protein
MSKNNELLGFDLRTYLDQIVQGDLNKFDGFITWSDDDKKEFKVLLDELKKPFDKKSETTKEKGDRLEKIVEFIIRKTYFFEIYKNVHTETNEIDEVIVFSNRGKQALETFKLARNLIPIDENLFLGECKNYESNLGVTYVGKFYSLMNVTGVSFGIVFTQKGLTGDPEGYKDAYGLTKVLRMVEKSRNSQKDFYILTFTMEDYDKLLSGTTFFELVKAKKLELQLASDYTTFIMDNQHVAEEEIKKIITECL